MKVMYEDTQGHIIWFHDVNYISDFGKFLMISISDHTQIMIRKNKIQSIEVIPDA